MKGLEVKLDLRALAALRISLGLIVLFDLLLRVRDLEAFYTDAGVLPRQTLLAMPHPTLFNFFNTVGTSVGALVWFALLGAAAFGLMIGWRTRTCAIITWILHIALKHRNPLILHAGDLELGLILWWVIFLPVSARYSVDARSNPEWSELPNTFSSVATFGYQLQLSLMYLMAALMKTDDVWRESGLALYYCFNLDQFATGLGKAMLAYPELLKKLTFLTLGFEFLIPVLLWIPWKRERFRLAACAFMLLLHLGIGLTLHLGIMVVINILMTVGLWPGSLFGKLRLPTSIPLRSPQGECSGYKPAKATSIFLALICVYICHLNYAIYSSVIVPKPIKYFGYLFRQQQTWSLFAPHPGVDDGWVVLEGEQVNGETIILPQGAPGMSKPASVASTSPNQRWRLWMLNLVNRKDPLVLEAFATYLARDWNKDRRGPERVKRLRIVRVVETTLLPGQPLITSPVTLYNFECPEKLYKKPGEVFIP